MIWRKPDNPIVDIEVAIKWWLDAHFQQAEQSHGVWAVDLYASYLDACVETKAMPVITSSMFGRCMTTLLPRSPYITRGKADDKRSGRKYLIQPLEGTPLVVLGKTSSGADAVRRLYEDASKNTGHTQSHDWLSWNDQLRQDKEHVSTWLAAQRLRPATDGERLPHPPAVNTLWDRFRQDNDDWKQTRFRRALQALARIKRGQGGARAVAELADA